MHTRIAGFDWDNGNRLHCIKHGVSAIEIEALFNTSVIILPDTDHSQSERRLKALGRTAAGRAVFLVFTIRERDGQRLIRPVSARYMHEREVKSYEEDNSVL